ncbi:hypothetical protein ACWDLG_03950 [Nonomuraea sp. NPDC003727]
MSPVLDVVMWIAVVTASVQAIAAVIHVRQGRTTSGSGSRTAAVNALVKRGLLVSVFIALWMATVNHVWERRQFGRLSYLAIRDELQNATFLRFMLFVTDVAIHFIVFPLACAVFVAIARSLIVGQLDRSQTLVHIVTLIATTASGASVVVADAYTFELFDPWWIVVGANFGLAMDVGGPVERSSGHGSRLDATTDPDAETSTVESVGGRAHQSPVRGCVLTILAWTLGALGLLMLFSGSALYKSLVSEADGDVAHLPLWVRLLIMAAVLATGGLLFAGSSALLKRGRQHRHRIIPLFEDLIGERYLLYLRPFAVDPVMALPPTEAPGWYFRSPFELPGLTQEEFVVRQFRGLGRVVAIGQPGERLPEIGAERGYVPVDDWQDTVSRLLQGAHAVIMTAAPGPGTMWEFTEALRTIAPTRLLLLIYGEADYHAFREGVAQEYATRSSAEAAGAEWPPLPQLPDIPPAPHTKGLQWDFPLTGILSFDRQWRPQFTRFPPTVPRIRHVWTIRRLVRRELKPVLDQVAQLPPAPSPA